MSQDEKMNLVRFSILDIREWPDGQRACTVRHDDRQADESRLGSQTGWNVPEQGRRYGDTAILRTFASNTGPRRRDTNYERGPDSARGTRRGSGSDGVSSIN